MSQMSLHNKIINSILDINSFYCHKSYDSITIKTVEGYKTDQANVMNIQDELKLIIYDI